MLADLDKGKGEHSKHANNGWLAFVQHYFVSAWLPPDGAERDYVVEKRADGIYAGRVLIGTRVVPGTSASVSVRLYAGPQEKRRLEAAAPGLDLVVDYGWLTIIAWPLFWLLRAAIELRHAPFMLWIQDLSALDPYYVLPILMTITMVLQTRMNPVPPDPVQAKVMKFMPFVFSIFFFFFPAGLVLYWLVNNILSILQQWQIQRMFDRDKPAHGKR